ncbi:ABC transporter B family member 1 [Dorcoceras hygrometricum]|uniref:ABC transporter B family member 1 n=1 Tax=Dorcoceras hygrometricum TaxID=472368 RepID=A0A2Z7C3J8_9LAMI|nr:ABC transporter B family member 1 [Dorcoceras hygrometricum]
MIMLIAVYSSSTRTSNSQIPPQQILLWHGNSSIRNQLPPLFMSNTAGTSMELKSRSSHGQEIALLNCRENTQLPASSRFSSNVNSIHLTGINRKSHSGRAQRHQSRSKQWRKSTVIYRRRVRMNSKYRGFRRKR